MQFTIAIESTRDELPPALASGSQPTSHRATAQSLAASGI